MNAGREEAPRMEASSHREEKITGWLQHPNRLQPTSELITLKSVTEENAHLPRVEAEFQGGPHCTQRQMSHLQRKPLNGMNQRW